MEKLYELKIRMKIDNKNFQKVILWPNFNLRWCCEIIKYKRIIKLYTVVFLVVTMNSVMRNVIYNAK
ncbi:hypothetical protein DBV15_10834 [Temnothorax longispinosus]|uniref:Uncharacterized protein n=1 Tax=Temnothorax longispinosus TaxID=300112 RepID=A0A4S2JTX1_9HYME|nr:hypothetical protein DBV15_10834 [Temnothorax longispinosus]